MSSEKQLLELEDRIMDLSISLRNKNLELEGLKKDQSEFIKRFIHNIKNPVGVIYSFADMVLNSESKQDRDQLLRHIGIIKSASTNALSLIQSLSDFIEFNDEMFNSEGEDFMISELLENLISSYKTRFEKKGISYRLSILDKGAFTGNSRAIEKCFSHIIENAIRFTREEGSIHIQLEKNAAGIELSIQDSGIGISDSDLAQIKNPFFTSDTYDTDHEKCVGLGLAIADGIVQAYDGTLEISSIKDKGTTVKLRFPS